MINFVTIITNTMKKTFLVALALSLFMISCKEETAMKTEEITIDSTATITDKHNAMISLDYEGSYKGSLPCADCEAIETTITLKGDTYTKETVYKGKSNKVYKEEGTYSWNKEMSTITLSGSEVANQYFVGENVLFHLDANGKLIKGDLAQKYRLEKVQNTNNDKVVNNEVSLTNSKWRLVKLNGKAVSKNKDDNRELGIVFTTDGRFSAYAGCNNMNGSFTLNEEESRITFSKVAMTRMACPDSKTEQELAEVLELADNYNFDGKTFKLNKARMAPIAEFELIK